MTDKKMVAAITLCLLWLIIAAAAISGGNGLKKTSNKTVVDGVIQSGEYSIHHEFDKMDLFLNWTQSKVYVAVVAETEGWIGVGFGSLKMNNAHILIGFVDNGKAVLKEQKGKGRSHRDTKTLYVQSFEMKETFGNTTLELEFKEEDVITPGQKSLGMIIAFGAGDSFTMYHSSRKGFSIDILD